MKLVEWNTELVELVKWSTQLVELVHWNTQLVELVEWNAQIAELVSRLPKLRRSAAGWTNRPVRPGTKHSTALVIVI